MSSHYRARFEAAFLVSHPKGPKMTFREAGKYLKKSEYFVRKWNKCYLQTGCVDDVHKKDRPRSTTKSDDNIIEKLFLENPSISIRQAREKLLKEGLNTSISTIQRRLKEFQIKNLSTIHKPLLTSSHMEKRLQWAQKNMNRDWSNIVFTDEASFFISNFLRRAWTKKGERYIERTVKHPAKVHVYGAFCQKGFGRLICFTGILDSKRMTELYKNGLLRSVENWFGHGNRDWILQEDNDPKHRSQHCTRWKSQNGITTMDWPSQSPDCNPIENVWGYMKQKLRGIKIKNKEHLIRVLKRIWKGLSEEYAKKLVESCDERCQRIIDAGGDWTSY